MWKNIKNFLEKIVGSEAPVTENKTAEQPNTEKPEPKIKQLKKANYSKKTKHRP